MATKRGNGNDNTINGTNNNDFLYGKGGQDTLNGLGGNDYLNGGVGDDFLFGGDGDDTLFGSKGSDMMVGGTGADKFKGGKGNDTADYSGATSGVTAYLDTNQSNGYATGDSFKSMENVIGSAYGDALQSSKGGFAYGGAGNDSLYGGGSYLSTEDSGRIRGDVGSDTLNMTYGNTEAWLQLGQGSDTIDGFIEGEDMLFVDLSEFGLGNSLESNEIVMSDTVAAVGGHAQFIYEGDAGNLWFDQNGSAAGGLTLVAQFSGGTIQDNDLGVNDFAYQL